MFAYVDPGMPGWAAGLLSIAVGLLSIAVTVAIIALAVKVLRWAVHPPKREHDERPAKRVHP